MSVAYIGPKSRTERLRKTKIGTEVARVTRDSDTTFEVKRSRSPGRFGWLYWQANMDIELVTDPYAYMMYIVSPFAAMGGAYCGGRPPTAYSCCPGNWLLKCALLFNGHLRLGRFPGCMIGSLQWNICSFVPVMEPTHHCYFICHY